jgi:hypothetical protein
MAGVANTHQASAVAAPSAQAFNTTGEGMGVKELAEFLSPQVLPAFFCFFAANEC